MPSCSQSIGPAVIFFLIFFFLGLNFSMRLVKKLLFIPEIAPSERVKTINFLSHPALLNKVLFNKKGVPKRNALVTQSFLVPLCALLLNNSLAISTPGIDENTELNIRTGFSILCFNKKY